MPRILAIDPAQATGKAAELMNKVKSSTGKVPNIIRSMAHAPAVLAGYMEFSGALKEGALNDQERELLALRIAEQNHCGYCLSVHTAIGKGAGLSEDVMLAARQGQGQDGRSQALIQFVDRIISTRGFVKDADLKHARDNDLSDGEILEVVAAVALNTLTNYINHVCETEVDFPKAKPVKT